MTRSMFQVRRQHEVSGYTWFGSLTGRTGTIVHDTLYPGFAGYDFFVTSERNGNYVRRYTIRVAFPDGKVEAVSDIGAYADRAKVIRHARRAGLMMMPGGASLAQVREWVGAESVSARVQRKGNARHAI